jgi:hypothetical protein
LKHRPERGTRKNGFNMKKPTASFRATSVLLGSALCILAIRQIGWGQKTSGAQGRATAFAAQPTVSFRTVQTQDRIVTVSIPADWLAAGTFDDFKSFSAQDGESFHSGRAEVWPDPQALRLGLRVLAQTLPMPPEQLTWVSRFVAPPLAPVDVIRGLYPQLAGGAIQNMRVSDYRVLFSQGQLGVGLIHYQFVLLPQRDIVFQSMLPPVLRAQRLVPMEGGALIMTFPLRFNEAIVRNYPNLAVGNVWTFIYRAAEAPQPLFSRNVATYAKIFASYKVDIRALQENYRQQQQVFEQMNQQTRETGYTWWLRLGGLFEGVTTNHPEPGVWSWPPGCATTKIYICGNEAECLYESDAQRRGCSPVKITH